LVVVLQPRFDRFKGIVGISRTQGNLQVGVDVPQLFNGLQAIPARRHAHVDEHHGIRGVGRQGLVDQGKRLLALVGGVQLEGLAQHWRGAEQGFLEAVHGRLAVWIGTQDLAEVLMDRGRVIDDQNATVGPS
jgi:hypothetical protein